MSRTPTPISQTGPTSAEVVPYETRLAQDRRWAMAEGSRFFAGEGSLRESFARITSRLNELGISYAVAGGMALFEHGYRRYTEDIAILVSADGLKQVHEHLDGLGYVPPFTGSKNLKDVQSGVRIEFLVAGQFPGDGKPKPVAFPNPANVGVEIDGIRYVSLPALVELKLASGTSSAGRLKDLGDVQELIRVLKLPAEFAGGLNEYVRGKYVELWKGVAEAGEEVV